jgi:hypothetical protein
MLDMAEQMNTREWEELTDEEIKECFNINVDLSTTKHIYRRIAEKLKEKNT